MTDIVLRVLTVALAVGFAATIAGACPQPPGGGAEPVGPAHPERAEGDGLPEVELGDLSVDLEESRFEQRVYLPLHQPLMPRSAPGSQPLRSWQARGITRGLRPSDPDDQVEFSVTAFVRNTDEEAAIRVDRARSYDAKGAVLQEYLSEPLTLAPLAVHAIAVERGERGATSPASLLIEWSAAQDVHDPMIEAVMHSGSPSSLRALLRTTGRALDGGGGPFVDSSMSRGPVGFEGSPTSNGGH